MYIDFKNSFVYKADTVLGIIAGILSLYMYIFLWRAMLGESAALSEMVTYQAFGIFLGFCYDSGVASLVGGRVMDGAIVMDFIKPYNYAASMLCGSLGRMTGNLVKKGIPYLAAAFLTTGFQVRMQTAMLLPFLLIMAGNMFLYWLIFFCVGLLHFMLVSAGWFERVMKDVIKLLGGSVIPLWMFSGFLSGTASLFPFWILFQLPQSMLAGTAALDELGKPICMLFVWIAVLTATAYLLWKLAVRRITVQGG